MGIISLRTRSDSFLIISDFKKENSDFISQTPQDITGTVDLVLKSRLVLLFHSLNQTLQRIAK